jgi:hypothetical protein
VFGHGDGGGEGSSEQERFLGEFLTFYLAAWVLSHSKDLPIVFKNGTNCCKRMQNVNINANALLKHDYCFIGTSFYNRPFKCITILW